MAEIIRTSDTCVYINDADGDSLEIGLQCVMKPELMLTLEPRNGFSALTKPQAENVAAILLAYTWHGDITEKSVRKVRSVLIEKGLQPTPDNIEFIPE